MSIAAQIERLQGIKGDIKTELIAKGISASAHNMEDFVADIRNISTGIDVSDTTATASDVIDGRYFYNSEGVKTEGTISFKSNSGDVKLQPTKTEEYRKIQFEAGYYPNEHGAYVDEMVVDDLSPSDAGTAVEAWKNYRTIGDGYFYPSRRPDLLNPDYMVHQQFNSKSTTVINCGFRPRFAVMSNRTSATGLANIGLRTIDFENETMVSYWGASVDSTNLSDIIKDVSDTGFTFYMPATAAQYWQMFIYS